MPAVNGVGKPCAGEPHARFDGRELETERRSGQGHGDEGQHGKPCGHQRLRDLPSIYVTAPALDPTRWSCAVEKEGVGGLERRVVGAYELLGSYRRAVGTLTPLSAPTATVGQ